MSFDQPPQNKMMTAPPAKKGFHFASDGIHFAEFIEAATVEEATTIYHKVKRVMYPTAAAIEAPAQSTGGEQQSTADQESDDETIS